MLLDKHHNLMYTDASDNTRCKGGYMKGVTVRLSDDMHGKVAAKARAELRPISAIIARLLELWLAGKIDLTATAGK